MLALLLPLLLSAPAHSGACIANSPQHPEAHFAKNGFHSLFDGESMEGWVTKGGRYDGHASWSIEEGALVGREGPGGTGGLIYTELAYTNFIFSVDVMIDFPFDSGIFVRMAPEGRGAQVTIDYRPDGEVGAIYSDGFLAHNTEAKELYKKDEWNHFEVICTGEDMQISSWMNGVKIADYKNPPGSEGFAARGLIGLQVHGAVNASPDAEVRFKNMLVRELPHYDTNLFEMDGDGFLFPKPDAAKAGWKQLFNGRDLTGWEAVDCEASAFVVEDRLLCFPVEGKGGYLRTMEDYQDFELQLDFRISDMANSGLFLRGNRSGGDPAYSGCEIQILDDFNWERVTKSKLEPYQFTGSLYGAQAHEHKDALMPLGYWNTYQVRYEGSNIETRLNGRLLYSVDTNTLENAKPPFSQRVPAGFIGLQRHAPSQITGENYAWFRNLFIRSL